MSDASQTLSAEDLIVIFGYKNVQCLYNAISLGRLPVPTYRLAGRRVADREIVRAYFINLRQEQAAELRRMGNVNRNNR